MINFLDVDWTLFFGCLFIAFSPSIAFFFIVVSRRPQLVIVSITSAFYWLLAILLTALIWYILPPLKNSVKAIVPISVIIQELFRWLLFKTYEYVEKEIKAVSTQRSTLPLNDTTSAFASGIGFGTMYAVIMYGSILASSIQAKGVTYAPSCPHLPFIFVAALNTLAFVMMHLSLMIIAFAAYRKRAYIEIGAIVLIHMGVSCSTLLNLSNSGCNISLPMVYGITCFSCFAAVARHRSTYM